MSMQALVACKTRFPPETPCLYPNRKQINLSMHLLQEKLAHYTAPQEAQAKGIYPYFRKIESEQDTAVS